MEKYNSNLNNGNPKNSLNVAPGVESLENNPEEKTLFNIKSYDDFKNWLKIGMEFEPSKKLKFHITPEFVESFGKTFDDLYPPHLTPETAEKSIFSRLSPTEKPVAYVHGVATLSFSSGFVRRLFSFKDDCVELISPGYDKVSFPVANPVGSTITAKFKVVNIKYDDLIVEEEKIPRIRVTYELREYSDLIKKTDKEGQIVPICYAVYKTDYIKSAQ